MLLRSSWIALILVWGCGRTELYEHFSNETQPQIEGLTVVPVYPTFTDWNQYVRLSETSVVACDAATVTGLEPCVHAGEQREVRLPAGMLCAGLTATDTLNAFTWRCDDDPGGSRFRTTGLTGGLARLVEAGGFRTNSLVISNDSGVLARTEATVWDWRNTVLELPANPSAAVVLADMSTIYYAGDSRPSAGYIIDADGIALVTAANAVITYSGNAEPNVVYQSGQSGANDLIAQVAAGGRAFVWIEGIFDANTTSGTNAQRNVLLSSVRLSRVHRFSGMSANGIGIDLHNRTQSNVLTDIVVANASDRGLALTLGDNDYNRFERVYANRSGVEGVRIYSGDHNLLIGVRAEHNGMSGIAVDGQHERLFDIRTHFNGENGLELRGANNLLVGLTASSNTRYALRHFAVDPSTLHDNTYVDIVAINNGDGAIYAQTGDGNTYTHVTGINAANGIAIGSGDSFSAHHTFANIVVANMTQSGVTLTGAAGSDGHVFADIVTASIDQRSIALANEGHRFTAGLWVSAAVNNCEVGGLTTRGLAQDTCANLGTSDAVLRTSIDVAGSFVGKVSGTAADAPWLGYGIDGAEFPNVDNRGPCDGSACQLWDIRLRTSDVTLRQAHGTFVSDAACPSSVSGASALVIADQQTIPNTFLGHAIERTLDDVGDDDGLCESNETCVFAPNLGAYQGEGELTPCVFSDAPGVRTVAMLGFSRNGVD